MSIAPPPVSLDQPIYALALPLLAEALESAARLLRKAAAAPAGQAAADLLRQRLAPDMFCLAHQVVVLTDSLEGAAALLAGETDEPLASLIFNRGDETALGEIDQQLEQSLARLERARARLAALPRGTYRLRPGEVVTVARPGHVRRFEALDFVWRYLLPNAYFHVSMIYALLRQAGVEVGKADFQGPAPYSIV
ncbi:DUF1993 family protein [Chitinimonas lacunae]|uniref:DUF1993 family protein n=1 Tax=Chitinimonas lacunae TaxID=1963018 RepID=A0ABV8MKH7_9NEIS